MDQFATWPARDRADLFIAAAAKRGIRPIIIEKDFWVCWILKTLFEMPNPPVRLIFKGGTSLSKVWNVIDRFSEDVDLSFHRHDLGYSGDDDPMTTASRKLRQKQLKSLQTEAENFLREKFHPQLLKTIQEKLAANVTQTWSLEFDSQDSQTLHFLYPTSDSRAILATTYLLPRIKLEFGVRSDHWPIETKAIQPLVAEDFPGFLPQATCLVRVIAAERTYWEKATILHSWYHAPADKILRDRQSRHYYDLFKLANSPIGASALQNIELLTSVAVHKNIFFAAAWAKYPEAIPGTLRLYPPPFRQAELIRDYRQLTEEMIFGPAPAFTEILQTLEELEKIINKA